MTMRYKLKFLRQLSGITQRQMSEFLGVDQSLVSRFENGERNPNPKHRKAMAELLGCDDGAALFKKGAL